MDEMPVTPEDVREYGVQTWPLVAQVIGVRLVAFVTGKKRTSELRKWSDDEAERLWWAHRICAFMTTGKYAWDRVTLSSWWMGMNPYLGDDGDNNPAKRLRDGDFRMVWSAAQHDYIA